MKFQSIASFDAHIKGLATPNHLYGVAAQDVVERQVLSSRMISAMRQGESSAEVVVIDLSEISLQRLKDELLTIDLLSANKILRLKNLEQASKSVLQALEEALFQGSGLPSLIIESEKGDQKLWERLEKKIFLVDLTKEKPWDRKTRLLNWVTSAAMRHGKTLQSGILETLYQKCHKDLSQMLQEIEKLTIYAKDVSTITEEHLNALCGLEEEFNSWAFSEAVVWGDKGVTLGAAKEIDAQQLHPLLGQLRYHYQLALQLRQLLVSGENEHTVQKQFPSLQPKTLQKYCQIASKLREDVLKKALNKIFECEVKAKSTSIAPKLLWIDLLAHLGEER